MTSPSDDEQPVIADPSPGSMTPAAGTTDESADTERTAPAGEPAAARETSAEPAAEGTLLAGDAVMDFRARWEAIQQGFVDDPRAAVSDADTLVKDVIERLSSTFDDQHEDLERQWTEGEPSTEDLRAALQRYRDFFQRLLTI
jgi:hypothetical protein